MQPAAAPDAWAGIALIVILILLVGWMVAKPAIPLIIAGILSILAGLLALPFLGLLGPAIGVNAIVGGLVLVGLGRLIDYVESLLKEAKAIRTAAAEHHRIVDWRLARLDRADEEEDER